MKVSSFMEQAGNNITIVNAIAKTWDVLGRFQKPVCSISGGADSDVVLDIIHKLDEEQKVTYVWFNTGLEYDATKRHLHELEKKYNIDIKHINAVKPILNTIEEYGHPFASKYISDKISRLQKHKFHFNLDTSYEDDMREFPRMKDALSWWHNKYSFHSWRIDGRRLLKEFLCTYPPDFSISDKCCYFTKKLPIRKFLSDNYADLNIMGVRKAEGGIRQATQNCFTFSETNGAVFRPIFWFTDNDREYYCKKFGITHSECYTVYGLRRTGCVGCPYDLGVLSTLQTIRVFEPGLAKAAEKCFGKSYEYTQLYQDFKQSTNENH
ncbi:MAG: phosphoadenosine phosphosulfate reductase family protein [Synergistaceae bacterium]|nr:phosphoadenosine phosphosulfate reductase family protein [Synergistaceae bacterium]